MSRNLFEAWLNELNDNTAKLRELGFDPQMTIEDVKKDKQLFEKIVRLLQVGWKIYTVTKPSEKFAGCREFEDALIGKLIVPDKETPSKNVKEEIPWWSKERNDFQRLESLQNYTEKVIEQYNLKDELGDRNSYKRRLSNLITFLRPGGKLRFKGKVFSTEQYLSILVFELIEYSIFVSKNSDSNFVFSWGNEKYLESLLKTTNLRIDIILYEVEKCLSGGFSEILSAFEDVIKHRLETRNKNDKKRSS